MNYEIKGGNLPVIVFKMNVGDSVVAQAGAMSWHTEGFMVSTEARGGLAGSLGRVLSGESLFQNIYIATRNEQEIAVSSKFPGEILAVELTDQRGIIVQKQSFLASDQSIESHVFFQKNLGAGIFGGEGFVMLMLSGEGTAFLEVDGSVHEHVLGVGEELTISTGHLVAMDAGCTVRVKSVGDVKSMLFGGEGLLNTVVTGPGKVYLQTMPLKKLKEVLLRGTQGKNNKNKK